MKASKIENLVNRISNAKRVTQSLLDKSSEFADFVYGQMDDLGVKSVMNGKYGLLTLRSSAGSSTGLVYWYEGDEKYGGDCVALDVSQIDSQRDTRLLHGDFNASYRLPNRSDILEFIGDAETILQELANLDKEVKTPLIDRILAESKKVA